MENRLNGIDPEAIDSQYRSRNLNTLTDHELFSQVAEIIAEPKENPGSFELHAPLELLARRRLLPFIRPAERELARLQMVSIGARYQAGGQGVPDPQNLLELPNRTEAIRLLQNAISQGDVELADRLCVSVCGQFDYGVLLEAIAGKSIWTLALATHAHIGVYNIAAAWQELGDASLKLLRGIVRGLAQNPDLEIQDTHFNQIETDAEMGDPDLDPMSVEQDIGQALSDLPRIEKKGVGIRGTIQTGEEAGLLKDFLAKIPPMSPEKRHQLLLNLTLNTSALSMIQESTEHSKFGWTHCFTLPQAAWSLAPMLANRIQMPQVTCSWVLGFQATLSQVEFAYDFEPPRITGSLSEALDSSPLEAAAVAFHAARESHPDIITELATQALIRQDAHLSKYVRACIDATKMNPQRSHLYLAGAAYLTALWISEHPHPDLMRILNQG
jgi:hypothetical protein